jgi:hypothetical protein
MKIIAKDLVGENCVTLDDGQKVYDLIFPELRKKQKVTLDFGSVKVFASPFFNASVGQLLKDFKVDELNKDLIVENISLLGKETLRRVIENSKIYYHDENLRKATDDTMSSHGANPDGN